MHDIHLVSFDNPAPPDYGGVIDVYYKIQSLEQIGVRVALHTFTYGRRSVDLSALHDLATRVFVYRRNMSPTAHMHHWPFIVYSRRHPDLLRNLLADNKPILFEGIHTTAFLHHPDILKRVTAIRVHNIEQQYYTHLARHGGIRSVYYRLEALKLARYEQRTFEKAGWLLPVSQIDMVQLPSYKTRWIPVFSQSAYQQHKQEPLDFVLFHGKLSVPDNAQAAAAIIRHFIPENRLSLVVAGKDAPPKLHALAKNSPHIRILSNPSAEELEHLLHACKVHLLWSSVQSGVKLKLIYALRTGRPVICNPTMVVGSGLEGCVKQVQTLTDAIDCIKRCNWDNSTADCLDRYHNQRNALELAELMSACPPKL